MASARSRGSAGEQMWPRRRGGLTSAGSEALASRRRKRQEFDVTLSIAIIGAGPAGYYTAEAAQKKWGADVRINVVDRLPTPYGLIRAGVAPDHQSIKAVTKRYEATNLAPNTGLVGNVMVGPRCGRSMNSCRSM